MSDFADWEPDDAVDVSAPDADPVQVALRLHEARVALAFLDGMTLPHWHQLGDREREVAVAIVLIVVAQLRLEGTRL